MRKNTILLMACILLFCVFITGCSDTQTSGDESVGTAEPQNTVSYDELKESFEISANYPLKPNSADGVGVVLMYENLIDEEIKYLTFYVSPYNAVGDMVTSEIDGSSLAELNVTGPISKDDDIGYAEFENVWYNATIKYIVIEKIEIEYMNGESVICDRDIPVDKRDK